MYGTGNAGRRRGVPGVLAFLSRRRVPVPPSSEAPPPDSWAQTLPVPAPEAAPCPGGDGKNRCFFSLLPTTGSPPLTTGAGLGEWGTHPPRPSVELVRRWVEAEEGGIPFDLPRRRGGHLTTVYRAYTAYSYPPSIRLRGVGRAHQRPFLV